MKLPGGDGISDPQTPLLVKFMSAYVPLANAKSVESNLAGGNGEHVALLDFPGGWEEREESWGSPTRRDCQLNLAVSRQ